MKNLVYILILAVALVQISCKKKEQKTETATTPASTPTPQLTVKINGVDFTYDISSSFFANPTRQINFKNSSTNEQVSIVFYTAPLVGNYTLQKYGPIAVNFVKNSITYRSVNGNLNVTQVDTNSTRMITKLSGSFSCQTDTTSNQSYTITAGSVSYQQ